MSAAAEWLWSKARTLSLSWQYDGFSGGSVIAIACILQASLVDLTSYYAVKGRSFLFTVAFGIVIVAVPAPARQRVGSVSGSRSSLKMSQEIV